MYIIYTHEEYPITMVFFFVVWGNHPTPWGTWGRFIDLNQDIAPPKMMFIPSKLIVWEDFDFSIKDLQIWYYYSIKNHC